MNSFWKNFLATLAVAALCANVALLFSFNARLAVIESKLSISPTAQTTTTVAKNTP